MIGPLKPPWTIPRHGSGFHRSAIGQSIGLFVAWITRMPAHPFPRHFMACGLCLQLLPKVNVLHRLFVGGDPASLLPSMDPRCDALTHVLAVGHQPHLAGALQSGKRLNHSHQLHAVVRCVGFTAPQFTFVIPTAQPCAPSPTARVALASTIGVDKDFVAISYQGLFLHDVTKTIARDAQQPQVRVSPCPPIGETDQPAAYLAPA